MSGWAQPTKSDYYKGWWYVPGTVTAFKPTKQEAIEEAIRRAEDLIQELRHELKELTRRTDTGVPAVHRLVQMCAYPHNMTPTAYGGIWVSHSTGRESLLKAISMLEDELILLRQELAKETQYEIIPERGEP